MCTWHCIFLCAVDPLLVIDSLLDESPPHINVSVNNLCQSDNYTITVRFGTRPVGEMQTCFVQSNTTIKDMVSSPDMEDYERVYVPEDITLDENEEYCYIAVLSAGEGDIDSQGIIDGIHHNCNHVLYACSTL